MVVLSSTINLLIVSRITKQHVEIVSSTNELAFSTWNRQKTSIVGSVAQVINTSSMKNRIKKKQVEFI